MSLMALLRQANKHKPSKVGGSLGGLTESEAVVSDVEDGGVASDEHITCKNDKTIQ